MVQLRVRVSVFYSMRVLPYPTCSPFHAATGIMTARMLIHLRRALEESPRLDTKAALASASNSRTLAYPASTEQTISWRVANTNQSTTLAGERSCELREYR